jgi:hypothetical protein
MLIASLALSAIYILTPIGALISTSGAESLTNSVQYRDVALTFSTDYDKEIPMTTHSGLLRLLDLQIELAKERGIEESFNVSKLLAERA